MPTVHIEAQKEQIINFKYLQRQDIDIYKKIVPKTIERLKSFMDKLHPDTTLEFKLKECNEVVPYFYNKKVRNGYLLKNVKN